MWLIPLLLASPAAQAGGFHVKTARAPLSAVEVERPLVLGRNWLEFTLGFDYKNATSAWSSDGEVESWESSGTSWTYTTETLGIRYGLTRRSELWLDVPFHYVRLTSDLLGTDTDTFGIGEPRFGWRLEWFRTTAPTTSIVTDLSMKLPAGNESSGTYIGGPNTVTTFPLSTGTQDLSLFLRAKRQIGPFAIEGAVGGIYRFSGVTQYVIETQNYQFLGRFKPGSELDAELKPTLQLGPIAVHGKALYRRRFEAAVGTTAGGWDWDQHLKPIAGSDGWSIDVGGGLTANVTRGLDLNAGISYPLRGEDLTFFPFEDLTPTRGITWSGSVELRY